MYSSKSIARSIAAYFFVAGLVVVNSAWAQQRDGGTGAGGNAGAGAGNGSTGNFPGSTNRNIPGNFPNGNTNIYGPTGPDSNRPVFLAGRVILDDGNKPNTDISIQRVCNGNPHTEGHTDSKGHFSFQLGANPMSLMDASENSTDTGGFGRSAPQGSQIGGFNGRGVSARDLMNCQLQASYPGYRSDMVDLMQRHALDNPDIGVIVLHRIGGVQGTAISLTSELAPKKARKDYEKGMQLAAKGKAEDAEQHLQQAVDEYPKYAVAWYQLGRLQLMRKDSAAAHKSFEAAVAADSKYVDPYQSMAQLAAQEGKWQEVAERSKQAVYLNPVEYPTAWFYNAVANYNLKNMDAAEKSAKEVVKLDGAAHHLPQIEALLAQLCVERADYAGAAQHLQSYLQMQPNAPNAAEIKQQLAKLQETLAQNKK